MWLRITDSLSRSDLKYLALVSKFFRSLCIPSLSSSVRLLCRHVEERENPPKWLAGARELKLRDESFSNLIVDSRLAHYNAINFFRSSSALSVVNVQIPRKFYYYLLLIPTIRHLELSATTVDDSSTPPALSIIQFSIFSLNPLRRKNGVYRSQYPITSTRLRLNHYVSTTLTLAFSPKCSEPPEKISSSTYVWNHRVKTHILSTTCYPYRTSHRLLSPGKQGRSDSPRCSFPASSTWMSPIHMPVPSYTVAIE